MTRRRKTKRQETEKRRRGEEWRSTGGAAEEPHHRRRTAAGEEAGEEETGKRRFDGQRETGDVTVTSANRKCSAVTGEARKIRDNAADWHNLLLRWEKLNDEGFSVAGNIVSTRLTPSLSNELLLLDESSSPPSPSAAASLQAAGAASLQDECSKLQEITDRMVAVVMKMERLMTSQRGIQDLEEFQFGPEGRKFPLFHSWNTRQFEASSRVLFESFSQELKLKQLILQELAHTASADLCMVYLSCWLHQPFSPPQTRLTLEAMLLETGHRPL